MQQPIGPPKPVLSLPSGTADLNIVGPRWNCPAVGYGPGDSALDHKPDECLPLDEFGRSSRVLEHATQSLARAM